MEHYKSGSRWRKWDLHLHTPETLKEDNYSGTTPEEKWTGFCNDINTNEAEISVVGVTDYLLIDNYKKFLSLVAEGKITKKFDLIIPNIELRLTPITADGKALNLHLIIDPDFVSQLDERIYSKLKLKSGNTHYDASRNSLIRLGKTINSSYSDEEAYKEGARKFVIDFDTLKEVFDNDNDLHKHCLIVVSNSSNDGATGITDHSSFFTGNTSDLDVKRQAVYKFVDAIFSANPSDRTYFLGKSNSDTSEVVIKKCGSLKPCIHGCDAHTNLKIFNPDQKRFCWIKANPTFEGLRQIIFEPQDRVMIQELIPDDKELYRVIDKIALNDANFTKTPIELNPNLNVIIGSRSSGKTTLLNSIANSIDSTEFAIRNKGVSIIQPPNASVFWLDGTESKGSEKDTKKGITYIPQNYINSLAEATESNAPILAIAESALFDSEGEVSKKKEALNTKIESITHLINNDIYQLFTIRKQISDQIEKIKKIGDKKGIEEQIKKIEKEIAKLQKGLTKEEVESLTKLRKEYSTNTKLVEVLKADTEVLSQEEVNIEDNENVFIDRELDLKSEKLITEFDTFTETNNKEYLEKYTAFVAEKKKEIAKEIKTLEDINKKILEDNKILIDKAKQNTSAELKTKEKEVQDKKLVEIVTAETYLKTLEDSLLAIIIKIVGSHKDRSGARQEFVALAKGELEGIEYSAVVDIDAIKLDKFLADFINFHNSIDAKDSLILLGYKSGDDTTQSSLVKNKNIKTVAELILADILKTKSGVDIQKAVEGIFSDFEFINYSLKYEEDNYAEMTPGKKSLVVLKLLVESSKDNYPILIDQPEDDLDSRSISTEIVEFLREKKKQRQIILVTHNANIAIKADAEEIIVANRHGQQNKNMNDVRFDYTTGAIENSFVNLTAVNTLEKMGIREHSCELLEGGEEAFENRRNKYNLK